MPFEKFYTDAMPIVCFTPKESDTLNGVVTVNVPTVIKLGSDVLITIDGVGIQYLSGEEICLAPNVSYTFATSTSVHKM